MSIASLGGPLNARYLTLPRTKVRDAISFATGGWIPEIGDASDEEILAMVQRGEISPQVANKIIMERAAAGPNPPTVELQRGKVPNLFPESGQQLDQSQVAQMNAMQRQGGRPADVSPPTGAGGGISSMIPQAVKDWWNSTPSNPLQTPQAIDAGKQLGDRMGIRGRQQPSHTDPYASTFESANNDPAPDFNPPPQLTIGQKGVIDAAQRQGGRPAMSSPVPTNDPYAEQFESANIMPTGPRRENRPAADPPMIYDPPAFSPDGAATQSGVAALPAPPTGAASTKAGGIVPSLYKDYENEVPRSAYDDPNAMTPADVFTQEDGRPDEGSKQWPSSPDTTGTTVPPAGVPQAGDGGIGDLLKKLNQSPNVRASVEGAEGLFGGGKGWEALTMLGLGLMASKNPSALGALGEAGLGTVKYLSDRRKEDRDEKRLANQDRRLDEAERRAGFRDELALRQFGYTMERDKVKDTQTATDDARKDKLAESTMAREKAMVEYYNRGGRSANHNLEMKEGERVSQARMVLQSVDQQVLKMMESTEFMTMPIDKKVEKAAEIRRQILLKRGYTEEGLSRLINDGLGISTQAPAGFNILGVRNK